MQRNFDNYRNKQKQHSYTLPFFHKKSSTTTKSLVCEAIMMNQQQSVSYTHIFSILEREGVSNNKFKQLLTKIKQQEQKV